MGAQAMSTLRLQQTIRKNVSVQGIGFWSGEQVCIEFRPAEPNSGITFVRDDLGPDARIPARPEYRIDMPRRTNLVRRGARVDMVEHVLAALSGLGIDNCEVGVDQAEMPGCDGSSLAFVEALDRVGVQQQDAEVHRLEVTETVRCTFGESWIEARPVVADEYQVRFELEYAHEPIIGRQTFELEVTPEAFRREIAPCRTFVLEREVEAFRRRGLGNGVTHRDLLVFGELGLIDNELRFRDECVRHKLLDVIGDMALTGCEIVGQIVAHKSGHLLHCELAKELRSRFAPATPQRACA